MDKSKKIILVISVILAIALIIGVGIYSSFLRKQKKRNEWVQAPEIHEGISVGGIDVGGLTVEEAEQVLAQHAQELVENITLKLHINEQERACQAGETGIMLDCEKSAQTAYALGREGTYEELKEEITLLSQGKDIAPCYKLDEQTAFKFAEILNEEYALQPQNAWLEAQQGQLIYHEDQQGWMIVPEMYYQTLSEQVEQGDFLQVKVPFEEIQAEICLEDFTQGLVRRCIAVTSFDGTKDNRGQNILKATEMLNGILVHSGETFSMNETIGDRTEENGWKMAPAIVDGGARREDQPGGGVCQVSTTLYQAVAKADLEVKERRNHSVKVNYVEAGLDATINTGTIDFVWENNTNGDIFLHAWIEEDTKLIVEIYGLPFEGFDEIKLESEYTGEVEPDGEMEVIYDDTKEEGYEKIEVERKNGSTYTSYKLYYQDGEFVRKEKLADSLYRAQNGQKIVGTKR